MFKKITKPKLPARDIGYDDQIDALVYSFTG